MGNILENEVLREGIRIMSQNRNPMDLKFSQKSLGDGESLIQIQLIDNSEIQKQTLEPRQQMTISRMQQLMKSLKFGQASTELQCKFESISIKNSTFKCCRICKQRIQQQRNTFWCNTCKNYVEIQNKFCLKATLIDETGKQDVTFFDEIANFLSIYSTQIEITADEWVRLSDTQKSNYLNKFDLNSEYQFLIKLKFTQKNDSFYNVQDFYKLQ